MLGQYFSIRQPDSGLTVPAANTGIISGLTVNPTQVDLKRVNTTISSYSFKLVDKDQIITKLVAGQGSVFFGVPVDIWIGRTGVSMPFADYFKLPTTKVKKLKFSDSAYEFNTAEETDRMNKAIFSISDKVSTDMSPSVMSVVAQGDISNFPASGTLKLDNEFLTYSSKNNASKTFTVSVRGTNGSTAAEHKAGVDVFNVISITDNPLTILLKLLISVGGGGTYDTLTDGVGMSQTLIDVAAIETLRTNVFSGEQFSFLLYNIKNALKFIEDELLLACNLRFSVSASSKISLALLDQSVFGESANVIDEDSITTSPKWEAEQNKIVNVIYISWDWDEGTAQYRRRNRFDDADSIAAVGERPHYNLAFRGIKGSLGGDGIVTDRGTRLIDRFSTPSPEISFNTHIDKHLLNVGDKALFESNQVPASDGTLKFKNDLEVISRAINFITGDVSFKLAFTSYTGIRPGYIAPSDLIMTVISQKSFTVATGRGAAYKVGWKMRLWNSVLMTYPADAVNEIETIAGDTITMKNNFTTTLLQNNHKIRFSDYDDASDDQKRYAFISDLGQNFADGATTYKITF